MQLLKESVALASISGKEYDVSRLQLCSLYLPCPRCMHLTQAMYLQIVFVPGGHGIAFDGPGNKKLASVLTEAYSSGIAIVSHFCWLSRKAEELLHYYSYCMYYSSLYCSEPSLS